MRSELQHRAIMAGPLLTAMTSGGPRGAVGDSAACTTVAITDLDTAIGYASKIGASTDASRAMLKSAITLRELRTAFKVPVHVIPATAIITICIRQ